MRGLQSDTKIKGNNYLGKKKKYTKKEKKYPLKTLSTYLLTSVIHFPAIITGRKTVSSFYSFPRLKEFFDM